MEILGRHYENGEPVRITVEGRKIQRVDPAWITGDLNLLPWIAPGILDLQINGFGGTWFSNPKITPDEVLSTLKPHFQFGITRMCPTLVTNSFEALAHGFSSIREACEREAWADDLVCACHLEGPYISSEDGPRGAHPKQHVRGADWDEFCKLQELSGNRIRLVTLAAEVDGAVPFIEKAKAAGIRIAIGHTNANSDEIAAAVAAGAGLSTHLGNGSHGIIRRHPNYIWDQLGTPELMASVITDGYHLPPTVSHSLVQAKGWRNVIITCDASGFAGCPPGVYREDEDSVPVEILDSGKVVVAGQTEMLAGSGVQTDVCVSTAVKTAGVSLKEALEMCSLNPARFLGLEEIRLRRGARADLILFDFDEATSEFHVRASMSAGNIRFGEHEFETAN